MAKNNKAAQEEEIMELSSEDVVEINEVSLEQRSEWQKQEKVSEQMDDFSEGFSVGTAMEKDPTKREGETPGEDMILADMETGLTGVMDGLGGEGSGDKASATAADKLPELYKKNSAEMAYNTDIGKYKDAFFKGQASLEHPDMRDSAQKALQQMWDNLPDNVSREMLAMYQSAKDVNEEVMKTKGKTTLTVGKTIVMPDGKAYEITINIGDSGAMKIREDGSVSELTTEDSSLSDAIAQGYLTPEQAKNNDHVLVMNGREVQDPSTKKPLTVKLLRRGMAQALGMPGVEPRVTVNLLREGESVVYMSDGVRDEILGEDGFFDAEAAAKLLKPGSSPEENAKALNVEAAKGTKRDEKAVVIKERLHSVADMDIIEDIA